MVTTSTYFRLLRALVMQPDCDRVFMLLSLDVSARPSFELAQEISKRIGLHLIFIAHDLSVVRFISDRIAVIYRGNIKLKWLKLKNCLTIQFIHTLLRFRSNLKRKKVLGINLLWLKLSRSHV